MIILQEGVIHVSVAAQKQSMNFQPQRVNVALKKQQVVFCFRVSMLVL